MDGIGHFRSDHEEEIREIGERIQGFIAAKDMNM